ncbi:MAG: indole-3-glycerol phosphate synthase TrpC [Dehalococcoidia bacterium]|nr:indole-3-glycerol phosphate synthase TrpC [Dehalococcoidia bacterium]
MILDEIVAHSREELKNRQSSLPLAELRRMIHELPPTLDFAAAMQGDRVRLIAEVKRASPSKGAIRLYSDPVEIAKTYALSGASAISVLTEMKYFAGSLHDLKAVHDALRENRVPLLRKDFLFDPYHIYESRAYGADAVLLIVAILTLDSLRELLFLSHQLGLQCLVEVHNEAELSVALKTEARIIGINNRNLDTLDVDLNTTKRLRAFIPPDRVVVSESGVRGRADVELMRHLRVDAVLVGEALMVAPDIAAKMKELL